MPHESRLTGELRALLHSHRVAALGTISDVGDPYVSMVPFAMAPALGCLVIHVSGLAAHTRFVIARPAVSLLVMQAEVPDEQVHALPRVTIEGRAEPLEPDKDEWPACRAAYLRRFPDVEHMTLLGDFRFIAIKVEGARHVAGFGVARSVDAQELRLALRPEGTE
jgi:putative heme iron utilization protein